MAVDPNEISCKELIELVTSYIEGKLSLRNKKRFESHLTICEGCLRYLEQMRLTIRSLGKLTEESIPPKAKQELLTVFRNWKRS